MKKLSASVLALLLALMMLLTSCDGTPDSNDGIDPPDQSTEEDGNDSLPDDGNAEEDHTHDYTEFIVVEPTCTKKGNAVYVCKICNYAYGRVFEPLGHSWVDATTEAPKTCSTSGITEGEKLPGDVQPDDNNPEGGNPEGGNTEGGNTEGGNTEGGNTEGGNPEGGNTEGGNTEGGNTEGGNTEGGDSEVVKPDEGHTHNYSATVTKPTCTDKGYTTYLCSCGDSYVADTTDALGHTEQTVAGKGATCTENGLTNGVKCSNCGVIIVEQTVISSKGHNYNSTVTSPTCTTGGYTTYVCVVCSHSYVGDQVNALGHSWVDATTEAPKTCSTCGTTEGDKLPSSTPDDSGNSGSTGYSDILYVNYINVGQGDSIFIKVGDCDILIDAGESSYGSTVSSYLSSKGVDDIELMINTHPDADHCGGLTTVLNNYVVEQVWASPFKKTTTAYTNFVSAVSKEGLSMKTPAVGTVFTYEYLTLTVIYNGSGATESNDASIVVMLEYGNFRFLFTGDISSTIENKLVSSGKDLSCDVLKVPHHGSAGSSSAAFLNATGASYGVICVGNNSYGHPTSAALTRLSSAGISVYRTDTNGHIVFSTNGASMTIPGGSTVGGGSGSSSSGGSSSGSSSSTTYEFIGNKESKVFHLPTCSHLPAESKRNYLYNYWWVVNIAGYTPCKICMKNYVP